MATTKNLCAQIPIALHKRVSEERERLGETTSEYITNLIQEYYDMIENQKGGIQMTEKGRTMAFQIPEELFQRIKRHLERETLRSGKKTTHVVYGEAMAILAGDALLTYAFETAAKALDIEPQNPGIGKAIRILSAKAGIYGMVGGQTVDVESENTCDMTKEKLDFIYRLKTSALIEASMMIGAVLAGATGSEQKIVEAVASKVGLAFQIQDDILDVTSTMEVLGKPIGSDEKNHKSTYVTYEGIEKAKQDVADLSEKAIAQMETLVVKNEFLTELLRYLISREK